MYQTYRKQYEHKNVATHTNANMTKTQKQWLHDLRTSKIFLCSPVRLVETYVLNVSLTLVLSSRPNVTNSHCALQVFSDSISE